MKTRVPRGPLCDGIFEEWKAGFKVWSLESQREGRVQEEVGEVDRGQVVGSLDPSCQLRLFIWWVKNTQLH